MYAPKFSWSGPEGALLKSALGLIFIMLTLLSFFWYRASVQADVYRRSGVDMSTWEVFTGSRPIERVIVP